MSSVTVARDRLTGYLMKGEAARFNDADFDQVLIHAMDMEASDVYFKTSRPVVARVHGRLVRLTTRPLQHAEVVRLVVLMYGANAEVELRKGTPLDQAFSVKVNREKDYRFRWCATGVRIDGAFGISVIMRELKEVPPAAREEEYHADLWRALFPLQGLVFITGETGAGKTTTLASWIRKIAEDPESDTHIVSFEAPIEYRLDSLATTSCEIDQSDVPADVASFALGVVNALRRDPDVILVGESRDAETIKAAVLAAQTGHLVLSTLHSNSVQTTFLRLIQACPVEELYSIMGAVIGNIEIIVCQRLVRSTDGRRCAVREHLVFNSYIRNELLKTAATNISLLPYRAGQLLAVRPVDVAGRGTSARGRTHRSNAGGSVPGGGRGGRGDLAGAVRCAGGGSCLEKNEWRNTALTVRFFIFDARAAFPFALALMHIRPWTMGAALAVFVLFGVLEWLGISMVVALRALRSWIAGPVRYGVAWWHKPQRKIK